jgi:hypothetical protein
MLRFETFFLGGGGGGGGGGLMSLFKHWGKIAYL